MVAFHTVQCNVGFNVLRSRHRIGKSSKSWRARARVTFVRVLDFSKSVSPASRLIYLRMRNHRGCWCYLSGTSLRQKRSPVPDAACRGNMVRDCSPVPVSRTPSMRIRERSWRENMSFFYGSDFSLAIGVRLLELDYGYSGYVYWSMKHLKTKIHTHKGLYTYLSALTHSIHIQNTHPLYW